MLQSMTGYSKKERASAVGMVTVEIETVNARYMEITLRVPELIEELSETIKKKAGERLKRGRVKIEITLNGSLATPVLHLDLELLRQYHQALTAVSRTLGLAEPVTLQQLLTFPDLFTTKQPAPLTPEARDQILATFEEAVEDVVAMREREGAFLTQTISEHLARLTDGVKEMIQLTQTRRETCLERYRQDLQALCGPGPLDENRLMQEAAMLVKRLDTTEESERLQSHIQQFRHYLELNEPVGKKLNFLIQEMNREITTLGTKAESAAVSHIVVVLKDELEMIREQLQNIV